MKEEASEIASFCRDVTEFGGRRGDRSPDLCIAKQILEDVPALRSYIDGRLRLGVQQAEDDQLLNGANTAGELTGLLNRPGLAATVSAGGSPSVSNADAILQQIMAILTSTDLMPDGIVLHPNNWTSLLLAKDSSEQYYGNGPFQPPTRRTLWGLPVVVTSRIAAGTALAGAFKTGAQLFRHGGLRVATIILHDRARLRPQESQ